LADIGTFQTNGSVTSETAPAVPTTACSTGSTCTLPDNTTTYPVDITTAATAPPLSTIYDASSASAPSGLGSIIIGGVGTAHPVGWWLNVPAKALAGTYTSTITLAVVAAP